jgi:hypothetical protein
VQDDEALEVIGGAINRIEGRIGEIARVDVAGTENIEIISDVTEDLET